MPSRAPPNTNFSVEAERIDAGTSATFTLRSTSRYAGSRAFSERSSRPSSLTQCAWMSDGIRKQTPPVRTDEPPTQRPAESPMIGVCPMPNAVKRPDSRQIRRNDGDLRVLESVAVREPPRERQPARAREDTQEKERKPVDEPSQEHKTST